MIPSLVIFDCDGVLVDTERFTNRNMAEIVTALGHPMTGSDCQKQFMGRTLEDVQRLVEALVGQKLPEDWPDQVRRRDLESFEAGVPAIRGIEGVLDRLEDMGLPYCVGSSGRYQKMRATLGSSGLLPRLEGKLFSAQDCERGKPAPDVFLLAARKMGHAPETCVVVEDSVPGVMAARSAGMRVYAFAEDPACDRDAMTAAGGILFDDMTKLPELLLSNS
ncbi:HAD family hydrolase [Roseibium sp. Sym1]|uniref:HAD family hydrolase n=1 Tax=Roseibium sp. Sym1 TaxID=3016006 RepID=UPI0022B48520|nr:HAD family hydrolase [Roseibium sp. Sym1]